MALRHLMNKYFQRGHSESEKRGLLKLNSSKAFPLPAQSYHLRVESRHVHYAQTYQVYSQFSNVRFYLFLNLFQLPSYFFLWYKDNKINRFMLSYEAAVSHPSESPACRAQASG